MKLDRLTRKSQPINLELMLVCYAGICTITSAFLLTPSLHAEQTKTATAKSGQPSSNSTKKPPAVKTSPSASKGKKVASRSKKGRQKVVRGQRTIESTRVVEIQNALAAAGYYKEQPSGEWDDSTTKAMSTYQQDNGFRTTGKPDALSLKKLGL